MASPWKFLSRLVLTRREHKQAEVQPEDAKRDLVATADPAEALKTTLGAEDRLDGDRPPDGDLPAAAEPVPPDDAEPVSLDSVGGEGPAAGGSSSFGDSHTPSIEGVTRKQASGNKKRKSSNPNARVSSDINASANDTVTLDEEIKVLRGELATKLQMQNAQLKKMLERFDR